MRKPVSKKKNLHKLSSTRKRNLIPFLQEKKCFNPRIVIKNRNIIALKSF